VNRIEGSAEGRHDGPAGGAAREEAAAQEGALERSISVHPSSSEAGDLAGGVEAGEWGPIGSEDAA
jgi:hypothetical protein